MGIHVNILGDEFYINTKTSNTADSATATIYFSNTDDTYNDDELNLTFTLTRGAPDVYKNDIAAASNFVKTVGESGTVVGCLIAAAGDFCFFPAVYSLNPIYCNMAFGLLVESHAACLQGVSDIIAEKINADPYFSTSVDAATGYTNDFEGMLSSVIDAACDKVKDALSPEPAPVYPYEPLP